MADSDFLLKIGLDSGGVSKGLKGIQTDVRNVGRDASRAFMQPQQALQTLSTQLSNFGNLAKGAIAGLAGAAGFKALTMGFMDYHTNLANAVQLQKYNVTELEALGGAMRRFGGDTSGAISSLNNLTQGLHQARLGQGALLDTARRYNLQILKSDRTLMSSEELLQSLSKQLNTFDSATKEAIAGQLGLDSALLRVIDSGNYDSLIAQQKKLNKTTNEDLKVAAEFESAWLDLKDTLAGLAKQISLTLLPPLTKLMKYVKDMIGKFKIFQHTSVVGWGAIGLAVIPIVGKLTSVLSIFQSLVGLSGGLKGFSGILSSISTIVKSMFSPMKLIAAGFLLLFLIAEDLYTYFKGGDSVFGDLAKQYPAIKKFLDGVVSVAIAIKDAIAGFYNFIQGLSWERITKMIDDFIKTCKDKFFEFFGWIKDEIVKAIKGAFDNVKNIGGTIKDTFVGGFETVRRVAKEKASRIPLVGRFFQDSPTLPNQPVSALTSSQASGNVIDNSTTNNKITIEQNIKGGDPTELGTATEAGVTEALAKTRVMG